MRGGNGELEGFVYLLDFFSVCAGHCVINVIELIGVEGLGILKGKIVAIPHDKGLKIPHIGWNSLSFPNEGRLFRGLSENAYVYFVHSYYLQAEEEEIVKATTEYGVTIHASVEKDNVFACQFHPEKSSAVGRKILQNFLAINREDN